MKKQMKSPQKTEQSKTEQFSREQKKERGDITMSVMEVFWIRHGETPSNKEHRYLGGRTDESLSKEGRSFLKREKEAGRYPKAELLFSSPMKRCLETGALLYPDQESRKIESFREMDFGAFEGKNYQELNGNTAYQAWIDSNGTLPFPEGESREDFICRCREGFFEMLREIEGLCSKNGGEKGPIGEKTEIPLKIAAVVHGGTIMALLSSFYGGEYFDYQVKNGGGYRCMLRFEKGRPVFYNVEEL